MIRIARITMGFALVVSGVFMLVLPGPGLITIVAGLMLLSKDLVWAGRLADWVKKRFGRYAGEGQEVLTPTEEADAV